MNYEQYGMTKAEYNNLCYCWENGKFEEGNLIFAEAWGLYQKKLKEEESTRIKSMTFEELMEVN